MPYTATPDDIARAKTAACPDFYRMAGATDAADGRAPNVWLCAARLRPADPASTMGEMLAYHAGYRGEPA
jgi:hypothetical protein